MLELATLRYMAIANRMRSMRTNGASKYRDLFCPTFSYKMVVIFLTGKFSTLLWYLWYVYLWFVMYTYGMYTYGMHTYGMHTYGMYTYGIHTIGMYTYGMYT